MITPGRQILETDRVILREYIEEDAEAFFDLNRDPEVLRYTGDDALVSLEQARNVLRDHPMTDYRRYGFGRWACLLKSNGTNIGYVGLKYLEERDEVDLGFRLLRTHWSRGLATEASRAVIRHGFDHLGLGRIIGLARPENHASIRVLEKVGMHFVTTISYRSWSMAKYAIVRGHNETGPGNSEQRDS
jgi:RimJ/RimL family protein N-acetyltransferase